MRWAWISADVNYCPNRPASVIALISTKIDCWIFMNTNTRKLETPKSERSTTTTEILSVFLNGLSFLCKRLPGLKNLSYEERLKYLGWPTLELRRLRTDLIWCYKILFGLVHLNADHLFQLRFNQSRGHRFKSYKQFSNSNTCSSAHHSLLSEWSMSVEFGSLSAFTKSIGRVNLNQILTVYKFSLAC